MPEPSRSRLSEADFLDISSFFSQTSRQGWAKRLPLLLAVVRRFSVCLGVTAFSLALLAAPAPAVARPAPAPKKGNATFGLGPANAKGIDGRAYYNYLESPGAHLSDDVAVVNIADSPVTLSLYATDAVPGAGGSISLLPASQAPTEAGAWITLQTTTHTSTVTLGPRATVVVPFAVAVPTAAEPGDHLGGIVASLSTYAKNAQGDIVHIDQRVAVEVFIRVSGQLLPRFTVENLHAVYHQNTDPVGRGDVTLSYDVRNTGNLKLSARQRVQFRGLFGTTEGSSALPDIPVLLPGAVVHTALRLHDVPPEFWGTVQVRITPSAAVGDVDPHLAVFHGNLDVWTLPLALLIIVAGLLLVALLARRRRVERRAQPVAVEVRAPVEGRLAS